MFSFVSRFTVACSFEIVGVGLTATSKTIGATVPPTLMPPRMPPQRLVFSTGPSTCSGTPEGIGVAEALEAPQIKLSSNRCGGILGGISVGGTVAPIVFDVAVKPTPTISKEQATVNLETKENTTITVGGRHDPCIVPRAVPVYEAVAALALADLI